MSEPVLFESRDGVALLTLARPEKLNALSYAVNDRLLALLDRIEGDDAIATIVLTGAGERAFSAGADIPEFAATLRESPERALRDFVRRGQAMTARIETFPKPVIAAVNGIAFGGGCEITEAAHLAIASERALFAKPEIRLGMLPTFGGTQRLPRLVGRKRALELLLTGETLGPHRAREIGLVNEVVPHDALLPAAFALAKRIGRHAPSAVAAILGAVARGLDSPMPLGLQCEAEAFARLAPMPALGRSLEAWITARPSRLRAKIEARA